MDFKYIESDIGKKKLKSIKRINFPYLISFILITIIYIFLMLDIKSGKIAPIVVFSVIYIGVALLLRIIRGRHTNRLIQETLTQEICLDGFINLNIYRTKKLEKRIKKRNFSKIYNYTLINIIDAYLRKGDFDQANNIIEFLEKRELDDLAKIFLIKNKASIAYYANNIEAFKGQYEKIKEISNLVPEKIKSQILDSLDLQKYMLENNKDEANKICDKLLNNKMLINRVTASYYKGIILEKENNEEYKKYYKYVVENGNDLYITKIASEKINMKGEIRYRRKKHVGFKILTIILFIILLFSTLFICDFYIEDAKVKKWDTGIVYLNNQEVKLPCTIEELESNLNVTIDKSKIDDNFYYLYLDENYFNIGDVTLVSSNKCITLYIKGNEVVGLKVDISNLWNDELDTELGNIVTFPGNITTNSTIDEIKETYKTGIINPSMREWSEKIGYGDDAYESSGISYSGDKYFISIDCKDENVTSIFYYCK